MEHTVELTRSGRVAVWEEGGGATNTGTAHLVAKKDGSPRRPYFIKKRGHLSCGQHALLPVVSGDYWVTVHRHKESYSLIIEQVSSVKVVDRIKHLDRCKLCGWEGAAKDCFCPVCEGKKDGKSFMFYLDESDKTYKDGVKPHVETTEILNLYHVGLPIISERITSQFPHLEAVVVKAILKSRDYHCRRTYYVEK